MESWIVTNCTGCTVGCNNCLTSSMQSATLQSLSSRIPFSSGTLKDEKQIITILPSSLSSHFPLAKHTNTTKLLLSTIEKRKCQYFGHVIRARLNQNLAQWHSACMCIYLLRNSICSFCRIIPVFIIIVWNVCLSIAQILTSVSAEKQSQQIDLKLFNL